MEFFFTSKKNPKETMYVCLKKTTLIKDICTFTLYIEHWSTLVYKISSYTNLYTGNIHKLKVNIS